MGYFVNGDKVLGIELKLMFGAFIGIIILALTKGGVIGNHSQEIG